MSLFLEQTLNGVSVGLTYALIALGFSLTYGVARVLNLAYGEIFMFGAFIAAVLAGYGGLWSSPVVVVLVGLGGSLALGMLVHVVAVMPLGDVSNTASGRHLVVLASTTGASVAIINLLVGTFGTQQRWFPLRPGEALLLSPAVENAVVAVALLGLFGWVLRRTHAGLMVRAVVDDPLQALESGLPVLRVQLSVVAVSSLIAGLGGILTARTFGSVHPFFGTIYGLKAIIIVIVAGTGRFRDTVLVAVSLGIVESLGSHYVSPFMRDAVAYAALLLVLLFRREPMAPPTVKAGVG